MLISADKDNLGTIQYATSNMEENLGYRMELIKNQNVNTIMSKIFGLKHDSYI